MSVRNTSQGWGNQTGTFLTSWGDSTGGCISFRRDNPKSGQMSMIIDGNIYIQEGNHQVEGFKNLWTGTLKGNNPISLDMTSYSRLRVWVNLYAVNGFFDIDLTHAAEHQQISGYPYCGGITIAEYTAGGSLELLTSECLVTTDKKTFSHFHCGYYTPGNSTGTNKDNDTNYYVYRIDGIV